MSSEPRSVTVYGAYGHTGRFIVAELCRRGWTPILSGRDAGKLAALGESFPALQQRPASIDDPASLDRALDGAVAVINSAGPFLDTAPALVDAALRARLHYLDVSAEQQAVLGVFERYADAARAAAMTVLPAMAFYGGFADLLATAAMGDWTQAERIETAIALDRWHPTAGTRLTGERNHHRRLRIANGQLDFMPDPAPTRDWRFPAPFADQPVVELPLSEIITISRHLRSSDVRSYMNLAPLQDLRDPLTPPPTPIDEHGRSAQVFVIQAQVSAGDRVRRASAQGRDIYAITAPLVVEALQRIGDGRCQKRGVLAPGEAFDARDFLEALPGVALSFDPA